MDPKYRVCDDLYIQVQLVARDNAVINRVELTGVLRLMKFPIDLPYALKLNLRYSALKVACRQCDVVQKALVRLSYDQNLNYMKGVEE